MNGTENEYILNSVNKMICLSKNLSDRYINAFAAGKQFKIRDHNDNDFTDDEILFRGITKRELIYDRWKNNKTFYYMDSGYIGNYPCEINRNGHKLFHRIVKNNLQHGEIIQRPADRWNALKHPLEQYKHGTHILLVTPSEKACLFYNVNVETWITETINTIKKYTDRPIKIRKKQSKEERNKNTIYDDLENCHALVTFNSIAAVEAVMFGVPAFTAVPTAADPVCDKDLKKIETPTYYDYDLRYQWACHLAYGQFHFKELADGTAYKILHENS